MTTDDPAALWRHTLELRQDLLATREQEKQAAAAALRATGARLRAEAALEKWLDEQPAPRPPLDGVDAEGCGTPGLPPALDDLHAPVLCWAGCGSEVESEGLTCTPCIRRMGQQATDPGRVPQGDLFAEAKPAKRQRKARKDVTP